MALSNITRPEYLPSYQCVGFSFPAGANVMEASTIVAPNGTKVANGTLNTKVGGIVGNSAAANNNEYFTLFTDEIAIVKVEAGEAVTLNSPIAAANTGTGRARVGVPGTDELIGYALDTSDGSGTALKPHYIRVRLSLS